MSPLHCLTCLCVEKDTGVDLDSDNENEQPTWRSFTLNVLSNKLTFTAFREIYDKHEFKIKAGEVKG